MTAQRFHSRAFTRLSTQTRPPAGRRGTHWLTQTLGCCGQAGGKVRRPAQWLCLVGARPGRVHRARRHFPGVLESAISPSWWKAQRHPGWARWGSHGRTREFEGDGPVCCRCWWFCGYILTPKLDELYNSSPRRLFCAGLTGTGPGRAFGVRRSGSFEGAGGVDCLQGQSRVCSSSSRD